MTISLLLLLLSGCPSAGPDPDAPCPDADADGVCDDADLCDGDDATGDADADGVCDDIDLCLGDDAAGDADFDGTCDGPDDACFGDDTSGDTDGDGVCDDTDLCDGDDATGDADFDGLCDDTDACFGDDAAGDTDADGVCDDADQCDGDDAFGDTDLDGVCDDTDLCDGDDATGDADFDGVCNDRDACFGFDTSGDTDADGVCDDADQCDGDDASGDTDADGVCDDTDLCLGDDTSGDTDADGVCDDTDLCDGDDALGDADFDGTCDGPDDACFGLDTSGDTDGDGVCDDSDLCDGDDAFGDADDDGICGDRDLCEGNDAFGDADNDGICDVPWFVRPGVRPVTDGLTWDTALTSLADAFTRAAPGDAIWVAGDLAIATNLTVPPEVTVLGGFSGNETRADARLTGGRVANPSTLSFSSPNAGLSLSSGAVLDGFAIDNPVGRVSATDAVDVRLRDITLLPTARDGDRDVGLVFDASTATIEGLTCRSRKALSGACLALYGTSDVTVTDLILEDIVALDGAALHVFKSTLTVIGATGNGLEASGAIGGLLYGDRATLFFADARFTNLVGFSTPAFADLERSTLVLQDVRVEGAKTTHFSYLTGGVLRAIQGTTVDMERTTFADIQVSAPDIEGGVIFLGPGTALNLVDSAIGSILLEPGSLYLGGVILMNEASLSIVGSTLADLTILSDEGDGSLITAYGASVLTIENSVLWDVPRWGSLVSISALTAVSGKAVCTPEPIPDVAAIVYPVDNPLDVHTALDGIRFTLAPDAPCVDAGVDGLSDGAGIPWRDRTTFRDGTLDVSPVDLGVHYDPIR